jgi:hypothetical protein
VATATATARIAAPVQADPVKIELVSEGRFMGSSASQGVVFGTVLSAPNRTLLFMKRLNRPGVAAPRAACSLQVLV